VFGLVEGVTVPIPADCRDGFLGAYWKRPSAYLDPAVRESISTFSKIGEVSSQLQKHIHTREERRKQHSYGYLHRRNDNLSS
jgi:hypothetical protein